MVGFHLMNTSVYGSGLVNQRCILKPNPVYPMKVVITLKIKNLVWNVGYEIRIT